MNDEPLDRDHANVKRCVVCGRVIPAYHANGRKVNSNKECCSAACRKAKERADQEAIVS